MASGALALTTTRVTVPDRPSLETALRAIAADVAVTRYGDGWRLKKATDWTPAEIALAQTALDTTPAQTAVMRYTRTSRDKDVLTTMAMIVRARGIPAWNALTTPQKVAAALAEADVWVQIRDFVESNL